MLQRQIRFSICLHLASGLMAHRTPFLIADLGPEVEPFLLHPFAALAEKEPDENCRRYADNHSRDGPCATLAAAVKRATSMRPGPRMWKTSSHAAMRQSATMGRWRRRQRLAHRMGKFAQFFEARTFFAPPVVRLFPPLCSCKFQRRSLGRRTPKCDSSLTPDCSRPLNRPGWGPCARSGSRRR